MSNILQTLKLNWEEVGKLAGQVISAALKREVTCHAGYDDYDYWAVSDTTGRFSHEDLDMLLDYVGAGNELREVVFLGDSDSTVALEMELSQALLRKKLNTSWEQELIKEDGLWLIGIDPAHLNYAGTITVDGQVISMDALWSKEELEKRLFEAGGSACDLSILCERYVNLFGNELNWYYPLTDGKYTGVCFVLVQEGVLLLPYSETEPYRYEVFEQDGARLLTAEDIEWFIADWDQQTRELSDVMQCFKNYLKARERNESKA